MAGLQDFRMQSQWAKSGHSILESRGIKAVRFDVLIISTPA